MLSKIDVSYSFVAWQSQLVVHFERKVICIILVYIYESTLVALVRPERLFGAFKEPLNGVSCLQLVVGRFIFSTVTLYYMYYMYYEVILSLWLHTANR